MAKSQIELELDVRWLRKEVENLKHHIPHHQTNHEGKCIIAGCDYDMKTDPPAPLKPGIWDEGKPDAA